MKFNYRIVIISFLIGVLVWIIDGAFDYFIFYEGTYWEALIIDVPIHEIYMRSLVVLTFVGFGFLMSKIITHLEKTREALRVSENYLYTTLVSIGDGVITTDPDGKVTFINTVAEKLTGWSMFDAKGQQLSEIFNIVNELTGQPAINPVKRVLKEGVILGLANHTVLIAKDGTRYPIDDSGAPIKGTNGKIIGAVMVFHDITERKQTEERIDHLNSVLRAVRNVNQLITKEKDSNRLIQGACENLIETKSYASSWITLINNRGEYESSAEAGMGEEFLQMVKHLKEGQQPSCWQSAREQAEPYLIKDREIDCGGCLLADIHNNNGTMVIRLEHGGDIFGYLTVEIPLNLIDVADEQELFQELSSDIAFALHDIKLEEVRKQAEEALEIERERLNVTLRSIGDGVITTDTNGNIILMNRIAEELTGWSEKEASGKPLAEVFNIINEKTRIPCENPVEKVMKRGVVVGLANHTVLISRDGSERFLADSGAPIRGKNGDILGVILVFSDITEKRKLQEFVSRAQRLETAGRIAGQIAHDFNNLLGPLVAYPDFIKDELEDEHPAITLIGDMKKAALQMSDINQQLLTLGRRGHYNLETINLNEIVMEVINQYKPIPEQLIIRTNLSNNIMNMKGGPSQIQRVVSNLITNAMDSMKNVGQVTIKTENFYVDTISGKFGHVPKGEYVKLTISDNGSGIPKDALPKIYDPFFTTKISDKTRGSGLGLSIVHAVIEDHNGYIDLETEIGKGTTFYLYYPITREVIKTPPPDHIVGGNEKILIVDDDQVQRDVTTMLLDRLGYEAHAVENGEDALKYIKKNPQDLLILDMVMPPGIDGTETYKRALEINPNQKAIIISGYAETEQVEKALKLGAGGYTRKPLTIKTLAHAVRKELDRAPEKHDA